MRSSRSDEPAPIVDKTRGARASRFAGAGYVRHYRTQAVDNLCDALARVSHETNGCATATHSVVTPLLRVPRARVGDPSGRAPAVHHSSNEAVEIRFRAGSCSTHAPI